MNPFIEDVINPINPKDLKNNSVFRIEWIRRKFLEISDSLNAINPNDNFFLIPGDKKYYSQNHSYSDLKDVLIEMYKLFLTTSPGKNNDIDSNKYFITKVQYLSGEIDKKMIDAQQSDVDYNKIIECLRLYYRVKGAPTNLNTNELKLYSLCLYYLFNNGNLVFSEAIWNSYKKISKYCCLSFCDKKFSDLTYKEYCESLIELLYQLHLFVEVTINGEQKYRPISISNYQIILLLLSDKKIFDMVVNGKIWNNNITAAYKIVGVDEVIKQISDQLDENGDVLPKNICYKTK